MKQTHGAGGVRSRIWILIGLGIRSARVKLSLISVNIPTQTQLDVRKYVYSSFRSNQSKAFLRVLMIKTAVERDFPVIAISLLPRVEARKKRSLSINSRRTSIQSHSKLIEIIFSLPSSAIEIECGSEKWWHQPERMFCIQHQKNDKSKWLLQQMGFGDIRITHPASLMDGSGEANLCEGKKTHANPWMFQRFSGCNAFVRINS